MIKLDHKNSGIKLETDKLKVALNSIKHQSTPDFEKTKTNLAAIDSEAKKIQKYKNVILIGNGGSRMSAWSFYETLYSFRNQVKFEFLSAPEPELVHSLRKKYSKKDTLVMAVSKSGDNINAIEPLLIMSDYPVLIITGQKENPFRRMAEISKWPIVLHPEVSGRFAGMTSCALLPAAVMGLSIKEIYTGARDGYRNYNNQIGLTKNKALELSLVLWGLEKRGYTDIFSSIYSTALSGMLPLIVQLIHESAGKKNKGQTIYGGYSPESQHHTNQRFFGGIKNTVGLFWSVENVKKDIELKVPGKLAAVPFKDRYIRDLNGMLASQTLNYDRKGVIGHAIEENIPVVEIVSKEITERSIGEAMVFWQYVAYYSSLLRGVDPFDQPEVERAKMISFSLRMKRKDTR